MASQPIQHPGRVSAITEHHGSSTHASIEVTHGKRKRSTGPDGEKGDLVGYDRPTSRVVVPKSHAKNFTMGQKVNVGITPATASAGGGADDGDEPDDDDDAQPAPAIPIAKKPAKKAKGAKGGGKPSRGPIFKAMTRGGAAPC